MSTAKTSVMGVGFIGKRYCELYPDETIPVMRHGLFPPTANTLFLRSTTSNYGVLSPHDHKVDVRTNLDHLMDVLPAACGTFNMVSSWFVWGSAAGTSATSPARETDPCDPNGIYSITKLAAEKVVRSYTETAGAGLVPGPTSYRILRLCNVIGNDPRAGKQKNALEMMLRKVALNQDVDLYVGDNWRNVMHVDDVCRAIHTCLTKGDLNTIYNVGHLISVRMIDLIEHAKARTGSKSRINLVMPPRFHQIVQVPDFWLDTTKLRSLGFTPSMDPYQAVDRVLANLEV
jgi:dTDP-glucose 4,6-dehydratase